MLFHKVFQVVLSLPSRERGLKLNTLKEIENEFGSLPSRERGLKLKGKEKMNNSTCRSLHGSVD